MEIRKQTHKYKSKWYSIHLIKHNIIIWNLYMSSPRSSVCSSGHHVIIVFTVITEGFGSVKMLGGGSIQSVQCLLGPILVFCLTAPVGVVWLLMTSPDLALPTVWPRRPAGPGTGRVTMFGVQGGGGGSLNWLGFSLNSSESVSVQIVWRTLSVSCSPDGDEIKAN